MGRPGVEDESSTPQKPGELQPIQSGHLEIEHDDLGVETSYRASDLERPVGDVDPKTRTRQGPAGEVQNGLVVIDEEHSMRRIRSHVGLQPYLNVGIVQNLKGRPFESDAAQLAPNTV